MKAETSLWIRASDVGRDKMITIIPVYDVELWKSDVVGFRKCQKLPVEIKT